MTALPPDSRRSPPAARVLLPALLLLFLPVLVLPLGAQETSLHSLILRDVAVADALEAVVSTTGIDLLYGAEVMEQTRSERVFCRVEDEPAEAVLRCVVESAGLDFYRLSSGTYVVIAGAEETPAYGTLTGVVTSRRSGAPLPHARIRLLDQPAGVEVASGGLFSLPRLLPGRHTVVVSATGYEPLVTTVDVHAQAESRVRFPLEVRPFQSVPIVVDGTRPGSGGAATGLRASSVDLGEILAEVQGAGSFRRGLPRILGVSRRPLLSDILIQGGEVVEQRVRLDGAPVFNPLAVEGLLGTFSPLSLERLTIRKAGFPARHGSASAGILDFEHVSGVPAGSTGIDLHVDRYNANGRLGLPVRGRGGAPGSVVLAARSTLWNLLPPTSLQETLRDWNRVDPLLAAALQGQGVVGQGEAGPTRSEAVDYRLQVHESDLESRDLHLASRLPLGTGRWLQGSLYRGTNEVSTGLLAAGHHESSPVPDRFLEAGDAFRWTNAAGSLRYRDLLGSRSTLSAQLHGSHHRFRSGYGILLHSAGPEAEAAVSESTPRMARRESPFTDASRIREVGGELSLEHALGPGHRLLGGVELTRTRGEFDLLGELFPQVRTSSGHSRVTLLAEDRWSRGDVALEIGLRGSWLSGTSSPYWEPRMAVEWEGMAGDLGPASVRLAGGLYRQFVHQLELASPGPSALVPVVRFWLPAEDGLPPSESRHLALETAVELGPGWDLRGELYHRTTSGLPVVDYPHFLGPDFRPGHVEPSELVDMGTSRASGAGVRLSRSGEHIRAEMGYDVTRARRRFASRFGGEAVPDPGNAPHRVLLQGEASLTPELVVRTRAQAVMGRTWAFRRAYYDLLTLHDGRTEPDVGRPGDHPLPMLVETDLSVTWSRSLAGARVETSMGVLNLLDRGNVLDYSLVRASDARAEFERLPRHLGGRTGTLSVRIAF